MTKTVMYAKKRKLSALWTLAAAALLIVCSTTAEGAVRDALDVCAHVLIPSLFPYMIISALIVRTGAAEMLGKPLSPLVRRLFRLPGCAAGAIVLGALCGFPVGAQAACELYTRGDLTKEEAQRLIPLANNTGPAFVMEVVGVYFWNSRGFGILIYTAQILSACLIAAVAARRIQSPASPMQREQPASESSIPGCLSAAVSSSAQAMLNVCGFVVFFAAVTSLVQYLLAAIGLAAAAPFTAALLEFTAGSAQAAKTGGISGAFLAGLAVGWSGISVFAQCQTFASDAGLSLRFAMICKGIQGILCGLAAAIWFALGTGDTAVICTAAVSGEFPAWALYAEIALLILFCLCPLPPALRAKDYAKRK